MVSAEGLTATTGSLGPQADNNAIERVDKRIDLFIMFFIVIKISLVFNISINIF
jgi:hypothetical protein